MQTTASGTHIITTGTREFSEGWRLCSVNEVTIAVAISWCWFILEDGAFVSTYILSPSLSELEGLSFLGIIMCTVVLVALIFESGFPCKVRGEPIPNVEHVHCQHNSHCLSVAYDIYYKTKN